MAWKGIIGQSFSAEAFDAYCHGITWNSWRPKFIVLHNTFVPTLAQRPNGFTHQHILNLESYFKGKGWSAGPHLFIDPTNIWVFTPLNFSGVHSPSWNKLSIGIEMLGDYQTEAFDSGRGLAVQKNAVAAMASLSAVLGLDPLKMKLHKEDPATTHKTCPGKNVDKAKIIKEVQDLIAARHQGEHQPGELGKVGAIADF